MKISECLSCGKLAIIELDLCSDCESKTSTEEFQDSVNQNRTDYSRSFAPSDDSSTPFRPVRETDVFPGQHNDFPDQHNSRHHQKNHSYSSCRKCQISIPVSQIYCSRCNHKELPVGVFLKVFAAIAVLIIGFYFYRTFINPSPSAVFDRYESVTGTENFEDFESFSFTGSASIIVGIAPHIDLSKPITIDSTKVNEPSQVKAHIEVNDLAYSMVFKKPGKSSFEILKTDPKLNQVIFKQAFDGSKGWRLINMPGQQLRIEDVGDGFSSGESGLRLSDFDEVVFLNDAIRKEYGKDNMDSIEGLTTFYINGKMIPTDSKVILAVKKKRKGVNDSALMMFDKNTGFLLKVLKKNVINGSIVVSEMSINSYKSFSVKAKPNGIAVKSVLLPERWVMNFEELNVKGSNDSLYTTIILNIDKVELGIPIDESVFVKPAN